MADSCEQSKESIQKSEAFFSSLSQVFGNGLLWCNIKTLNTFSYSVNHILEGKHKAGKLLKSMSVIHAHLYYVSPLPRKERLIVKAT